jgi:F-type H+-transporting ATPase subunit b
MMEDRMHKTICTLAAALVVLIVPAVALAGGGDSEIIQLTILHAINLALLFVILFIFVRKPLRAFLTDRKSKVTAELEEAARLREEAAALLAEYEEKFSGLDAERDQLLADYRQMGEAERERIIQGAHEEAARIGRDAEATMAQEVDRAKAALEAEIIQVAVEIAEQTLRERLDAPTQARLVDGFLTGLASDQA